MSQVDHVDITRVTIDNDGVTDLEGGIIAAGEDNIVVDHGYD